MGTALLGITTALSACATMRADVTIRARPEQVWRILSDLGSYPAWNPFFVRAKGRLQEGETLELVMKPAGKPEQKFHPKILEVRPDQSLRWRGRLFVPFLFDGAHQIRIEVLNDGWVRFTQYEEFSGIFVPFVGFEPYRAGWVSMNQAIKQRAEATESKVRAIGQLSNMR